MSMTNKNKNIEAATFRRVVQCLKRLCQRVSPPRPKHNAYSMKYYYVNITTRTHAHTHTQKLCVIRYYVAVEVSGTDVQSSDLDLIADILLNTMRESFWFGILRAVNIQDCDFRSNFMFLRNLHIYRSDSHFPSPQHHSINQHST
jgi:hypothetical protein